MLIYKKQNPITQDLLKAGKVNIIVFVTPFVEYWLIIKNSLMGPPYGIDPTNYCTISRQHTTKLCLVPSIKVNE